MAKTHTYRYPANQNPVIFSIIQSQNPQWQRNLHWQETSKRLVDKSALGKPSIFFTLDKIN